MSDGAVFIYGCQPGIRLGPHLKRQLHLRAQLDEYFRWGTTGAATVGAILPYDRSYDWGGSDIGIKHRFVVRDNYELPFGKNGSRMTKLAIGDWQLNTIAFLQSGLPFTVLDYVAPVPSNVSSLVTNDRPNQVGTCNASNQSYTNWINFSSFTPKPRQRWK